MLPEIPVVENLAPVDLRGSSISFSPNGFYRFLLPVVQAGDVWTVSGFRFRRNSSSANGQFRLLIQYTDDGSTWASLGYTNIVNPTVGVWHDEPTISASPVPSSAVQVAVALDVSGVVPGDYEMDGTGFSVTNGEGLFPLRLEIEREPDGLVNLVENPSGELGGYGWLTAVPGSVLRGVVTGYTAYEQGLEYTSAAATNNYFTTEPLPVSAGQYVAARWHVNYTPYNYYRARFVWLDASGATLSTSSWTSFSASYTDHAISPVVAPASTAFVRLSFEIGYVGGVYPDPYGGHKFSIREVTVAKAATSGALATVRTNLLTNPSFETNTTGWSTYQCTIARSTAVTPQVGTYSLAATLTNAPVGPQVSVAAAGAGAVVGGQEYTFSLYVRDNGTKHGRVQLGIKFLDAANAQVGTNQTSGWVTTTGAWQRLTLTVTTPPTAVKIDPSNTVVSHHPLDWANGDITYIDAAMLEKSSTAGTYFSGATADAGGWDYAWTGTANASTSTGTYSQLPFVEPVQFVNVLDKANEVSIVREELNLGTLTAAVLSEDLDPSVADTIRPGRRVRFTALRSDTLTFEPLITGKVLNADVSYDLLRKADRPADTKWARITLTMADPVQALAAASRPKGVGKISDLAYVLEGCGVPWVVNGDSNQIASATVVSRNEDAKAIDQIAITRDSELGYAWVDRYGVLQAWSALSNPSVEMITNGDFEDTISTWWAQADAGTPTFAASTVQKYSGTRSARLASGSSSTTVMQIATYQTTAPSTYGAIPVTAGTNYRLSMQCRANTTGRTCFAYVVWYDVTGSSATVISTSGLNTPVTVADNNAGWTELALDLTAPPGATCCDIVIGIALAAGTIPSGEAHFFDAVTMKAVSSPVDMDETGYSNIDVSFSTDDCINEVGITFLRYNAASQSTEEIAYGPYVDQASIDEWGRHSKTFVIQWKDEDANAIEDFAQSILAKNATPVVRVNSARVPIRTEEDLVLGRAFLDLYDLVHVTNTEKDIDEYSRITRITHTITSEKWLLEVGFAATDSVASPQVTPSVQSNSGAIGSGPMAVPVGGVQMFAGSTAPTGWLMCDGSAVSRTTYARLFAVIGTTFGAGNGSTTFNIPDTRRRKVIGVSTVASTLDLGQNEGDPITARSHSHNHTVTVANHTHGAGTLVTNVVNDRAAGSGARAGSNVSGSTASDGGATVNTSTAPSTPYLGLNMIIKV